MILEIQSWLDEMWEMDVNAKMTTIEKVKEFINNLMRQDRWIHVDLYYNNEGPLDEDCTLWECKIRHDRSRLDAFPHDKIIVTCVSLHGGSRGEVHGTDSLEDIVWLAGKRAGIPEDQQQILIVDKRRKCFDVEGEAMSIRCSCGTVHALLAMERMMRLQRLRARGPLQKFCLEDADRHRFASDGIADAAIPAPHLRTCPQDMRRPRVMCEHCRWYLDTGYEGYEGAAASSQ